MKKLFFSIFSFFLCLLLSFSFFTFTLSSVSAYTILEDLSVKGSIDLSGYNLTFGSDEFNLGRYISLNFNQGGSVIYDDTNLHIKTDDNLWLDAPGTTYVENDMALKGNTLTLAYDSNNQNLVNLGKIITLNFNQGDSSIYDDTNLHLKTDDNMYLDAPGTIYAENDLTTLGTITAGRFVGPLTGDVTGNVSGTSGGLTGNPSISITNLTATGVITLPDNSLTDSMIPDTITASNYLPLSGGTLSGDLNLGTNNITNINSLTATSLFGGLTGDVTGSLNGGSINTTGFTFNSGATAGYVLTTNASGVGSWTDLSSTGGPWTLDGTNIYPDDLSYNVGIGTTSPSGKFHVSLEGSGDYAWIEAPDVYPSGLLFKDSSAARGGFLYTDDDRLAIYTGGILSASNLTMLITETGYVGIGTTEPSSKLDVRLDNMSGTPVAQFYQNDATFPNGVFIRTGASTSGFALSVQGNAGDTQLLLVNNNGNVGIGTTSPSANLDLNGDFIFRGSSVKHVRWMDSGDNIDEPGLTALASSIDQGSLANINLVGVRGSISSPAVPQNNDTLGALRFSSYTSSVYRDGAFIAGKATETWSASTSGTKLLFATTASGNTNPTYQMVIDENGNVGIGTTIPDVKLHVLGGTVDTYAKIATPAGNYKTGVLLQRGNTSDSYDDWKIYQNATGLYFDRSNAGSDTNFMLMDANSTIFNAVRTTIGKTSNPIAYSKLSIYGTANSESEGADILAWTSEDSHPVFYQRNSAHDNISLNFDAYFYDPLMTGGRWTSSDAGSNYQITKLNDRLQFNYASGITAGNEISSWNTGFILNSSGNVGIGTTTPGAKLEVNGGVKLNTVTTKPFCDMTHRGEMWFVQSGTGYKDTLEVCAKDVANNYGWRTIY